MFRLTRLCCCVRLVESTRPHKQAARAMLAVIERVEGAPSRDEILRTMLDSSRTE